jgi:hypothetical protein
MADVGLDASLAAARNGPALTREQVRRSIGTMPGAVTGGPAGYPTVATNPGRFFGWGAPAPAIPAAVAPSGVAGVPINSLPPGTPAAVQASAGRGQASTMGAAPSQAVVAGAGAQPAGVAGPASQTFPAPFGEVYARPLPPQPPLVLERNVPWGARE